MFSKLTRLYLIIAGNLTWYCGGAPCFFTNYKNSLVPSVTAESTSRFRRILEFGHVFVDRLYWSFVAYRLITLNSANAPISVVMQTAYVLACYSSPIVLDCQIVLKRSLPFHFVREFIHYFHNIENKFGLPHKGAPIKCNKFLSALFVVGNLIFLQNFLLMRKHPTAPHFLTSLLGEQQTLGLKVPLVLVQCWIWYNVWTNIYLYIFPIYVYACCANRLVCELK